MWKQSVWSSLIANSLSANHLKEGELISLTGAKAAIDPTRGMIGYGVAKAAVHSLTRSLAEKNSGLPANCLSVAILPVTLDAPMNRKWMPKADHTSWTLLEFVAELFYNWCTEKDRPANGSLMQLITSNSQTSIVPV